MATGRRQHGDARCVQQCCRQHVVITDNSTYSVEEEGRIIQRSRQNTLKVFSSKRQFNSRALHFSI